MVLSIPNIKNSATKHSELVPKGRDVENTVKVYPKFKWQCSLMRHLCEMLVSFVQQ